MLLLHSTGATKIGDVRRYTVTYTPSQDRILPLPAALYLRIKNTSSLPLRAAYLHGPYTLSVSVRRQECQPWRSDASGAEPGNGEPVEGSDGASKSRKNEEDTPMYEPHLKAGASFYATLPIPPELIEDEMAAFRGSGGSGARNIRRSYEHGGQMSLDGKRRFADDAGKRKSVTWVVEVSSQIIFSNTANIGYELLLGRDEKSLSFGYPYGIGNSGSRPTSAGDDAGQEVLSRAITMKLETTYDLWNTPPFPSTEDRQEPEEDQLSSLNPEDQDEARERRRKAKSKRKPKKVHLVIVTHGLHGNTGADMLFIKEAIDEEERKAASFRQEQRRKAHANGEVPPDDADEEQVIVRGYQDNCGSTEKGIKYLGKRMAKYVLHLANPSFGPPPKRGPSKLQKKRPRSLSQLSPAAFSRSDHAPHPPYKVTSISFIGHSLGGLVQTYAIAYIHAHHPTFFAEIKPINFVAFATPFLGLSGENPMYVKFALDFGLVGRTGQDLGLSWRTPNAFAAFSGNTAHKSAEGDSAKPLLRILPTGPAHEVLKMFRNRTVYANVVNDGIVPLRTSCLLFLDWKGLGRVEKARKENGTVTGLVEWGIGQLVTQYNGNGLMKSPTLGQLSLPSPWGATFWGNNRSDTSISSKSGAATPSKQLQQSHPPSPSIVPAPTASGNAGAMIISTSASNSNPISVAPFTGEPTAREQQQSQDLAASPAVISPNDITGDSASRPDGDKNANSSKSNPVPNPFSSLMTLLRPHAGTKSPSSPHSPKIYTRSQTISPRPSSPEGSGGGGGGNSPIEAPPRTTILEAATSVLNPPLPTAEFINNLSSRPLTIFHERVYHSADIPPPAHDGRDLPVEEKIARAYHKDMSWRKVLVRLQPDAHNNIVVRRCFPNAYGWPVVEHLVRTHFGGSYEAVTSDEQEPGAERVMLPNESGENAEPGPGTVPAPEEVDITEQGSIRWDESAWMLTDDETDTDEDGKNGENRNIDEFLDTPTAEVSKIVAVSPGKSAVAMGLLRAPVEESFHIAGSRGAGPSTVAGKGTEGSGTQGRSEAVRSLESYGSRDGPRRRGGGEGDSAVEARE